MGNVAKATHTNEELCAAYQSGDHDALCTLWKQNSGLLFVMLQRLYTRYKARASAMGLEFEDFVQSGFIALESAARAYRQDAGAKFSTYLQYHVTRVAFIMLGLRTERERREPLTSAQRMESPIPGEDEELTIGDMIPDKSAALAFENAQERVFMEGLSKALNEAMATLPDLQAAVLRSRFYDQMTIKQIAERDGLPLSKAKYFETNALNRMRRQAYKLRGFAEELIFDHAYNAVGFDAWKNSGSIEERIIERIETKYPGI